MRFVIAMDSFKGSLTSLQACEAVATGLRRVFESAEIVLNPLADGGEGTAETVHAARNGDWIRQRVMGPLPDMLVEAGYAWFDGSEALVEMATASGLTLLDESQLDPLRTTTYGTGELIRAALDRQPDQLWLTVGGSATVDGGVGAAMALGWRFLDGKGEPIGLGGGELAKIHTIESPEDVRFPPIEVLCDVGNPLCGERGAAHVFGPQKGALPDDVELLDASLENLAEVIERDVGREIRDLPGAGAAGGLAGGAVAFLGATLVSGIGAVMQITGLSRRLAAADWVVTGEGKLDRQSLFGKVVSGVSRLAREHQVEVAVLAGTVELSEMDLTQAQIAAAEASKRSDLSLEEAMQQAAPLLSDAAERLARRHLIGR